MLGSGALPWLELPGAFGVGNVGLRGNRNLINCKALGKTKLFLLPSSALWPPGREPPRPQSEPRAGRGVLGPAEQGWGSLGTLLCCCVPCCPSLGALTPQHPLGGCREPQLGTGDCLPPSCFLQPLQAQPRAQNSGLLPNVGLDGQGQPRGADLGAAKQ